MKTSRPTVVTIIAHRLAGCGIRRTEALCEVHRDTVMRWSCIVGEGCLRLHDRLHRNLCLAQIELDELHTFVRAKSRRGTQRIAGQGEIWIYAAVDTVSRAVIGFEIGPRDLPTTVKFCVDVHKRVVGQPQFISDGNGSYITALKQTFGEVALAQIEKRRKGAYTHDGRRVADVFDGSETSAKLGCPNLQAATTNHVERFWGTARTWNSKLVRKSHCHAKSVRNLAADMALLFAYMNFCHVPGRLGRTPAMALGITDHIWSVAELVDRALAESESLPRLAPLPVAPSVLTENAQAL